MNQLRGKRNLGLSFKREREREREREDQTKPAVRGLAGANVPSPIAPLVISTMQFIFCRSTAQNHWVHDSVRFF